MTWSDKSGQGQKCWREKGVCWMAMGDGDMYTKVAQASREVGRAVLVRGPRGGLVPVWGTDIRKMSSRRWCASMCVDCLELYKIV